MSDTVWLDSVVAQLDNEDERRLFNSVYQGVSEEALSTLGRMRAKDLALAEVFMSRSMAARNKVVAEMGQLEREISSGGFTKEHVTYTKERIAYMSNSLGGFVKEFISLVNLKEDLLRVE